MKKFICVSIVLLSVFWSCVTPGGNFQTGIDPKVPTSELSLLKTAQIESGVNLAVFAIDGVDYGSVRTGYKQGDYYLTPGKHKVKLYITKYIWGQVWTKTIEKDFEFLAGKTYTAYANTNITPSEQIIKVDIAEAVPEKPPVESTEAN